VRRELDLAEAQGVGVHQVGIAALLFEGEIVDLVRALALQPLHFHYVLYDSAR
jgi:hypothetical protein